MNKDIKFSHDWSTIKMLGEFLYSNPWNALSELIANGFDAKSDSVYINFNFKEKKIYIFDKGIGMDEEELNNYIKIGYNKRVENKNYKNDKTVMGRKGIGKFATLYLSNKYSIHTKVNNSPLTSWLVDSTAEGEPRLQFIENYDLTTLPGEFKSFKHGTCLVLTDIKDTFSKKEQNYTFINNQLSNFFSYFSDSSREIYIKINNDSGYRTVHKNIAFLNMSYISYSDKTIYDKLIDRDISNTPIEDVFQFKREREQMINGKKLIIKIDGWIGLHSTIDEKKARCNDKNYTKGYIPSRISLYVRNKLAYADILPLLKNTQTLSNYIEGDIHCDILDSDDLPDIASTNRQSMNEMDPRFNTVLELVKENVKELIKRNNDKKNKDKKMKKERDDNLKKDFLLKLKEHYIGDHTVLNQLKSNDIPNDILKEEGILFFSHSSCDKCFSDVFYHYLIEQCGVQESEIFYTSSPNNLYKNSCYNNLEKAIRDTIINKQSHLIYFNSKNHVESDYCMFECGAGWVTRIDKNYLILGIDGFEKIPKWLENTQLIVKLRDGDISDDSIYYSVVHSLNNMIDHLNKFRLKDNIIERIDENDIKKRELIVEYWEKYVSC